MTFAVSRAWNLLYQKYTFICSKVLFFINSQCKSLPLEQAAIRLVSFFFFKSFRTLFFIFSVLPLILLSLLILDQWTAVDAKANIWVVDLFVKQLSTLSVTLAYSFSVSNTFDFTLTFLIDDLAIFFIIMSVLIVSLMIVAIDFLIVNKGALLLFLLVWLEYAIIGVFLSHDFLSFFFFFEATLLPMFCIILFNGSGQNTTKAAYWLAVFTLLSSIFFIIPSLWIYRVSGMLNFSMVQEFFSHESQDSDGLALLLCSGFFLAFAIKVPVMPLHIWLPEVHVEAPTPGSMLLASLLLKLGGYGIIRICLGIFPLSFSQLVSAAAPLFILSLVMSATIAVIQTDTKKIVAYSSIAHMSVALLGLVNFGEDGYVGAVISMFAHSLTSPALFFLVGCLYERYHTRNLLYFGGLSRTMPLFTSLFFLFVLSNTSFPGFLNFIGEVQVFYGFIEMFSWSWVRSLGFLVGIVAVTAYNFLLFARICWGNLTTLNLVRWVDLVPTELSFLIAILVLLLYWGFTPKSLLYFAESDIIASFV